MLLSEMGRHHQGDNTCLEVGDFAGPRGHCCRSQNGSSKILRSVFRGFAVLKASLKSICGIKWQQLLFSCQCIGENPLLITPGLNEAEHFSNSQQVRVLLFVNSLLIRRFSLLLAWGGGPEPGGASARAWRCRAALPAGVFSGFGSGRQWNKGGLCRVLLGPALSACPSARR